MKKFVAGLFTAILTTAGLVAVTSAVPASAACTQYVCVATTTVATGPKSVVAGKSVKIKVKVAARSGNAPIRGKISLAVKGPGGFSKTLKVTYNDRPVSLTLGKLKKPGKYSYTAKFTGVEGYRDSQDKGAITVKKKRKA